MARILNKQEFENEVLGGGVAMVDFFATWCGPCKMLSPVIDELAEELDGKALIAKVDIDQIPDVAETYAIKLVPTMLFFKDGKEVDKIVGPCDKEDILEKLNALI